MTAGIAHKNPYPSLRHNRVATVQTRVIHKIRRRMRPHRTVSPIGDYQLPARREIMGTPMEIAIRMLRKMIRIGVIRPDGLRLGRPKQEVEKPSLRDIWKDNAGNGACRP